MTTREDGDSDSWTRRKRLKMLSTRAETTDLGEMGGGRVHGAQPPSPNWEKRHEDKQHCRSMVCFLFNGKNLFWVLLRRACPGHSEGKMLGPWKDNFLMFRPLVPPRAEVGWVGWDARLRLGSPGYGGGCCIPGEFPGRLPALRKTTQLQEKAMGPTRWE